MVDLIQKLRDLALHGGTGVGGGSISPYLTKAADKIELLEKGLIVLNEECLRHVQEVIDLREQLKQAIKDQARAYTEGYDDGQCDCIDENYDW